LSPGMNLRGDTLKKRKRGESQPRIRGRERSPSREATNLRRQNWAPRLYPSHGRWRTQKRKEQCEKKRGICSSTDLKGKKSGKDMKASGKTEATEESPTRKLMISGLAQLTEVRGEKKGRAHGQDGIIRREFKRPFAGEYGSNKSAASQEKLPQLSTEKV